MNDTIAAISTPFGEGAIAVLRLSGPQAIGIADGIFHARQKPSALSSRVAQFGRIFDEQGKIDDVLLTVFKAPASYTGEDMVEISGHGGVLVARKILELILKGGARPAEPGEFTRRAFLNSKLDLTQAEAVMDLIQAQTDLALRAANEQLEGRLGGRIAAMRETLLALLAHVEAYIDFPDEDISPDTGVAMLKRLESVEAEMNALLATAAQGRILREGLRTVICGAPNAGKSSLLNLLVGHDRAIVNSRPGTTRDVLEELINVKGIPIRLMDTAGLRATEDDIEREGIERTHQQIGRADLVLEVVDASAAPASVERANIPASVASILVLNKTDLGAHAGWEAQKGIRISALRDEGTERLLEEIVLRATNGQTAQQDWSVAINVRHQDCLQRALTSTVAARKAFADGLSAEFIAEELRAALVAIGDVVGRVDTEDLLGVIFSQFCIGK